MNRIWSLIRTTLLGGIIFLIPLILFILILQKAFALVKLIVDPIVKLIPYDMVFGLPMHRILGLTILIIVCLIAGYFSQRKAAGIFSNLLEEKILSKLPGYAFYKRMGESMVGFDQNDSHQVVWVKMDDARQLAFLMDRLENDTSAVFVPDAPNPFSGALLFVTDDRIEPSDISPAMAYKILKQMGAGSGSLVKLKVTNPL